MFNGGKCFIMEKKSGHVMVTTFIIRNEMFPLDVSQMENFVLKIKENNDSMVWHLRYGHMNFNGLKLLRDNGMVSSLPKITHIKVCEGYVQRKQTKIFSHLQYMESKFMF